MVNKYFPVVPRCAGLNCQNEKREVNHWFLLRPASDIEVQVLLWDDARVITDDMRPMCGLECLHRELDRELMKLRDKSSRSEPG